MSKFGKDNNRKRHANERMRTSFANSGRIAGMGILHDNYSEDSFPDPRYCYIGTPVKKPETEEEKNFKKYGGKVRRYKLSKEEIAKLSKEDKP